MHECVAAALDSSDNGTADGGTASSGFVSASSLSRVESVLGHFLQSPCKGFASDSTLAPVVLIPAACPSHRRKHLYDDQLRSVWIAKGQTYMFD
jgi:hypothetical protein